ncbi:ABC transporter permease [Ligilactobacillus animalis]|jgi:ABC-2 type transport system permease protein|uniref:ABC transporter permease n=1 Tax=Ligilactobacillus animalis TaxID=1605 RepID=UPI0025943F33|nr:ABC transporter permease [Ligilactobacillus animalis]
MIKQVKFNFKRIILRNPSFLFFDILLPVMFYLLFTKVMSSNDPDFERDYLVSMMIYANLLGSVLTVANTLVTDYTSGYAKLLQILPLKRWQYYVSVGSCFWLLNVLCVIALGVAGWIFNGIVFSAKLWSILVLVIPLLATPLMLLGVLLATTRNVNTVNVLGNIVFLLAIISGLWWPFELLPHWIQVLGGHTPVYYVAEIARELVNGGSLTLGYFGGIVIWSGMLSGLIYLSEKLMRRVQ